MTKMVTNGIRARSLVVVALFVVDLPAAPQAVKTPAPSGEDYRISGTIVSKSDAHPLARARVTITDVKNPRNVQSVITADNGKFEFIHVPPGKYSLAGAKRGFISASYDQHDQFSTAIVTGAGLATEALTLRIAPHTVIAGRVLDEVSEPVRHAMVTLYYDDHASGMDQIHQVQSTQTDDQGVFEFTPSRPGVYFLSASAKPWYAVHPVSEGENEQPSSVDRSLDVAYPVTYYPDVTEAEGAAPIPVRGGERVQAEIRLNPVPSLRLRFRVPDTSGNGGRMNGYRIPQLQQSAFDGSTFIQSGDMRVVSPGLVEVTGIPAGRYNVRIGEGTGAAVQMNGVDLEKDGEEVDTARGDALTSVKVSVKVLGESTLPLPLGIGLRSGRRVLTAGLQIDAKGEAEFRQVAPGPYEVLVWGQGKAYTVAHMVADGAEVSGHTLTVPAGLNPSISLTLVAGNTDVQGKVHRAGKAFAGAMVVLVPKNPENTLDLFRRDQSDLDGTFTLRGVIPGAYTILAIENGWDLDWSQPQSIAPYLKRGRTVQVSNRNGKIIDVAAPVEVQSK